MSEDDAERHELDDPGKPLCPNCLGQNEPDADFCTDCGCPLSAIATTDPLRRMYSQGFWYRTAASGRIRPIVFWGTWLVLGPSVVGGAAIFAWSALEAPSVPADMAVHVVVGLLVGGGLLAAVGALLYLMTRNYLEYRRESEEDDSLEEEEEDGHEE